MAVDANTGEIAWATRLGITEELPEGKRDTGSNNTFGGPIVTAGGLVFIGATGDRFSVHSTRGTATSCGRSSWTTRR